MARQKIDPAPGATASGDGVGRAQGRKPVINIQGDRVCLGPFVLEDAPIYQGWMNDLDTVRRAGFPLKPMTVEQMSAALERWTGNDTRSWFVIYEKATWRPIGLAGLSDINHFHRSAEFNICIGEPDCRGKGYGTEVTRLVLDYAFTALCLHSVHLITSETNIPGQRAYRKAGFREYGRRRQGHMQGGHLYDLVYMDCLASEFQSPVLAEVFGIDGQQGR